MSSRIVVMEVRENRRSTESHGIRGTPVFRRLCRGRSVRNLVGAILPAMRRDG